MLFGEDMLSLISSIVFSIATGVIASVIVTYFNHQFIKKKRCEYIKQKIDLHLDSVTSSLYYVDRDENFGDLLSILMQIDSAINNLKEAYLLIKDSDYSSNSPYDKLMITFLNDIYRKCERAKNKAIGSNLHEEDDYLYYTIKETLNTRDFNSFSSSYVTIMLVKHLNVGDKLFDAARAAFMMNDAPSLDVEKILISPDFINIPYFKNNGSILTGMTAESYTWDEYREYVHSNM